MEYCHGGSLYDLMLKNSTAPDEKILIALGIAKGLSYMHAKGMVHLDIKPKNFVFNDKIQSCVILEFHSLLSTTGKRKSLWGKGVYCN